MKELWFLVIMMPTQPALPAKFLAYYEGPDAQQQCMQVAREQNETEAAKDAATRGIGFHCLRLHRGYI